jgi:hypothetical protein
MKSPFSSATATWTRSQTCTSRLKPITRIGFTVFRSMQFVASMNGFESVLPTGESGRSATTVEGVFAGLSGYVLAFANTTMSRASSTSPVCASTIARGAVTSAAGTRGTTAHASRAPRSSVGHTTRCASLAPARMNDPADHGIARRVEAIRAASAGDTVGVTVAGSSRSRSTTVTIGSPFAERRTDAPRPMTGRPRWDCSKRTIVSPSPNRSSPVLTSCAETSVRMLTTARARVSASARCGPTYLPPRWIHGVVPRIITRASEGGAALEDDASMNTNPPSGSETRPRTDRMSPSSLRPSPRSRQAGRGHRCADALLALA